ncbi:MAG TPA: glycosyltransferase family 4 protein [Vicinamibacterales bacterium]|jgi:glycosyltransferase involved in cell wall biosynthesis|nr:glycosyltransferase family 4 protein [Vicinamibacterales bacterium]
MHICFFNRSYWPDFGATGQLLTELAEDLVTDHGCEVTVVSGYPLRNENGLPRCEVRNGVEIVRAAGTTFDPQRFSGRASNYLTYFLSASVAGLGVRQPDVVVALTDPPIIGLAALLAARRSGARFVFLCEDVFPEVAILLEDFHSQAVNSALDRMNRFLLRRADAIVAVGDTMKRRLVEGKGADPQRISVIHNWADCAALAPGPRDNSFACTHGLGNSFVVMHAGNIGLSQQLDILLEAAERLRAYDDIRFVIVGDGSRRAALEQLARARALSNVVFLPYQTREEMPRSYASADMFVVSLRPGLAGYIVPSKLYGILAAGRPYVAAVEDACEVAGITREYDCGFVVPPGDADALASRILDVYRDRSLAARLGERARVAGLAYDRRRQVAAYASLFRRVGGPAAG